MVNSTVCEQFYIDGKAGGFFLQKVLIFCNNWWNEFYLSQENWVEMKISVQNNKDQNTLGIYNISPLVTVTHNGVWHAIWSHNGESAWLLCNNIWGKNFCLMWGRYLVFDGDAKTGRRLANAKLSVSISCKRQFLRTIFKYMPLQRVNYPYWQTVNASFKFSSLMFLSQLRGL